MKQSWIEINNRDQEDWAKRYLLKKRANMTPSNEGLSASNGWNESEPALSFLLRLKRKTGCEASSVLLKKMELSWVQQANKHRTKKTRPVNISIQSSNQLKQFAKAAGMTKVSAMEYLISTAVAEQKAAIVQQKELHEQRKQKLEACELGLSATEKDKHRLENELTTLKMQNLLLSQAADRQKEMIRELEKEKQKVESELQKIKGIFQT